MDLEKEIELLKEKVALLEKIKELQDIIKGRECISVIPYIPYVPQPYIIPQIIYEPIPYNPPIHPSTDPINPVPSPWYYSPNTTIISETICFN